VINMGAPMDVLWMRVPRYADDPDQLLGRIDSGRILVLLYRGDYWQVAYVIPKGSADKLREKGLPFLRDELARLAPFLRDSVSELHTWDDIKLLTVDVDRLRHWSRAGLLCIGDAAHAMSPIGGVGINLAIQDAVATANILGEKLLRGTPTESDLQSVQHRRMFPTRATQRLQLILQNNVVRPVLDSTRPLTLPWPLKLLQKYSYFRRFPARLIGVGFRPEHVRTRTSS
jgi:2-polyprenyl-6-methoxyphenol hydroxylase-like FAD-dependent oxidoreductase